MMGQPPAQLQDVAQLQGVAHLHSGPQAQAGWALACWQPQVQAVAGQLAHWQVAWVVWVMAFLLEFEWLKEMPV
jgi:hypothetical protein